MEFFNFWKLLSEEVETISWESEAKRSTLYKSKFGHRKLLRKWFWSYLELKKRMFWAFEKSILQFFINFSLTKLKPFLEKVRQSIKSYLNQYFVIGSFFENDFGTTLRSKTSVVSIWKEHCSVVLQIFEWQKWNDFLGKIGKTFQTM